MEKAQGTLTTPNWPESDYPPGISCSWHIIAPSDQVLTSCLGCPAGTQAASLKQPASGIVSNVCVLIPELALVESKTRPRPANMQAKRKCNYWP